MLNRQRLSTLAILAAIAGISIILWRLQFSGNIPADGAWDAARSTPPIATSIDPAVERRHRAERIATIGPAAAYAEFKREYAGRHFSDQHIAAHVMGELLYETGGMAGLAVCDDTFAFGCYHSFFGAALAKQGTAIIADLDTECRKHFGPYGTGCQHGIGHGLMEYFGPRRLTDALKFCEQTTMVHPLLGCTSGVFMEHNTPIVIGTSASQTLRELDRTDPMAPCPSLAEQFRPSCYFEMAPWWKNYFGYEDMGRICAGLAAAPEREACFLGIGHIVVPSNEYRLEPSQADCRQMPTREGEVLCHAGMWWGYFVVPERRSLADGACAGLTPAEQSFCLIKGRLVQ